MDKWPYIEYECQNGHKQRFTIETELYELLFQQATYCIMDGYYREAIGTYHAALERFFEFAIEMLCLKMGVSDFEKFWKTISRQSERQLGAYYALWTCAFKETPELVDPDRVKVRNDVVHNGKLISKEDAKAYGKYVFNYIKNGVEKLTNGIGNDFIIIYAKRWFRVRKRNFERLEKEPIITVQKDGEEFIMGVGSVSCGCFLNDPLVVQYEDCFKVSTNRNVGLIK